MRDGTALLQLASGLRHVVRDGPPGNSSLSFTVNSLLFTIDFVVICRFLVIFLVVSRKKRNFAVRY